MQKIKLIALDLDGTTLDDSGCLRPRTKKVLEQAGGQGIHLIAASGRAFSTLPTEILELPGLGYTLTSNGAATYEPVSGKRCLEISMEAEKVDEFLKMLEEDPEQELEVFYDGIPYASEEYVNEPTRYGAPEWAVDYLQRTRKPVRDIRAFAREHREHLDSIDIISADPEKRRMWIQKLEEVGELYVTSSVFYRIEVSNQNCGKGMALKKVAELLQIRPEEIIAFGNAENDMDMLRFAGLGVAVANSPDIVKEAADRIAPSNEEEGVAQVLEELLGL